MSRSIEDIPASLWPELLQELIEVLSTEFSRCAASGKKLTPAVVVLTLAQHFGGRQWYLPRAQRLKKFIRDADISRRLGKESAKDLAGEFGLTEVHVYRIAKEFKLAGRKKHMQEGK